MKKLIFFDIDGTILTQGKNRFVPESTKKAIRLLQENGNLCFINTGRSRSEIHSGITDMGFDGYVCGCGTFISYHDNTLLARELPPELADSIMEDVNLCRLEWIFEGQHATYYSTEPYTTHIGDLYREFHREFPDVCSDVMPGSRGLVFDKFCICTRPDSDLMRFTHKYQDLFFFIDRGNGFYEVVPEGCSKASGIRFLMDYFHIPLKDTIAIGDSTNDLPMLTFSGLSIGMKESDPAVLEAVDYVTDSIEHDGIYKAMRHFGLI